MNADKSLADLLGVIGRLTAPDGCPWDREQTPRSLADYVIEESHELVEAIRSENPRDVREELGDVFFLLLFITGCYEKNGVFGLADVLNGASAKMIRRHPHVFADAHYENRLEQLKSWEEIKKREHEQNGAKQGLFASLPKSLPPLVKAYRINSKAAGAGFTWPEDEEVEQQVESEWLELLDALRSGDKDSKNSMEHELGDIFFSLVELGRRKGIKSSEALDLACNRFLRRYGRMEELAAQQGRDLSGMSLDEKDELWNAAKNEESSSNGGKDLS